MSQHELDEVNARRRQRLAVLSLVVGLLTVGFTYLEALDGPFLWDDLELLKQNCVRSLCSASEYLRAPFWNLGADAPGVGLLYRPVTTLSLALDRALHGQNATGFHLTNLVLHLLNVVLLAALARRLGASGWVAAALATFWGVLPRLVESVAWIAGRTDILYSSAALMAILVWHPERRGRRVGAVALGLISALAKEGGVGVLLGLAVAEAMAAPRGKRMVRVLLPALTLGGYAGLRLSALPMSLPVTAVPLEVGTRLVTMLEAIGRFAWMSVDLWHPQAQMGVVGQPRLGYVGLGVMVLVVTGYALVRWRPRPRPLAALVVIIGLLPMLLVVHVIPMPWVAVVGDRLGYLSWGLLACGIGVWVARVPWRRRWAQPAAWVIFVALTGSCVVRARQRVRLFADEIAFWTQTVDESADANWGPTINLSGLYLRGGLFQQAKTVLDSLQGRCPSVADVTTTYSEALAKTLVRLGNLEAAEARLASIARPVTPNQLLFLARLRLGQGSSDEAEALAKSALQAEPNFSDAEQFLHTLGRTRELRNERSHAHAEFSRAVLEAEIDMLSGRLTQAERGWTSLLGQPELPKPAADEAMAFICSLGSAASLNSTLAVYASRANADTELIRACQDKRKFADALESNLPRVTRILLAKNSTAGHCREYGPFSD